MKVELLNAQNGDRIVRATPEDGADHIFLMALFGVIDIPCECGEFYFRRFETEGEPAICVVRLDLNNTVIDAFCNTMLSPAFLEPNGLGDELSEEQTRDVIGIMMNRLNRLVERKPETALSVARINDVIVSFFARGGRLTTLTRERLLHELDTLHALWHDEPSDAEKSGRVL